MSCIDRFVVWWTVQPLTVKSTLLVYCLPGEVSRVQRHNSHLSISLFTFSIFFFLSIFSFSRACALTTLSSSIIVSLFFPLSVYSRLSSLVSSLLSTLSQFLLLAYFSFVFLNPPFNHSSNWCALHSLIWIHCSFCRLGFICKYSYIFSISSFITIFILFFLFHLYNI